MFVLGGGSNLVIADEGWPGLVLKVSIPGIEAVEAAGGPVFRVGAGEEWDKFVAHAIHKNYAGIECMSGLPGTVGGTPVQNVGAYGQEVSETITGVCVLEIATGKIRDLTKAECGFSYRTSIFNSTRQNQFIVLCVDYRLSRDATPRIEYADLRKYFASTAAAPTLQQTREAGRRQKTFSPSRMKSSDESLTAGGSG